MSNKIKLVSVVGPTASGKTRLAVELAKVFDGEIVSADSMQIYQGMRIATAKPTEEEKQGIPHHLMGFLPPEESYSVARFTDDAKKVIADIDARGKLPILAGGTGLYIDSLLGNITFSEGQRDEAVCDALYARCEREGIGSLLETLHEIDPVTYEKLKTERNPKRIVRAIEYYQTSGKPISSQVAASRLEGSPYDPIKLGLIFLDREKLYERINRRVELMLEDGLLEEARQVLNRDLSFTSVKAIGYKELIPYFENKATPEECIEKLKRETRRYAKRQLTWFKRDRDIHWLYPDSEPDFAALLDKAVHIIKRSLNG